MKRVLRTMAFAWVLLALALVSSSAQAAWWEFGRSDGEPVLTDLKINTIDILRVEELVVLTREDLQNGGLTLRGRAEVRRGLIGLVEYSLDGGQNWVKTTVDERGAFAAELRLDLERDYEFRLRAITTTGQKTREDEHSFTLKVTASNPQDEVRQAFMQMLQAYMQENRSAFMRMVAKDFEGNETALEDAITDDFRYLDNIRIEPQISRIARFDKAYEIYFTFNRQVTSNRSGKVLRDSAASTVSFVREGDGFKLSRMAAPLIFGLSGASEVATSVTAQSVGTTVLVIDPRTGNASTAAQGSTVPAAVVNGHSTLYAGYMGGSCDAFGIADDDLQRNQPCSAPFNGDIMLFHMELLLNTGVTGQLISGSFDSLAVAPETGYHSGSIFNLASGSVVAIKLLNGKYALLEVTSLTPGTPNFILQFRYKYQPSGSRNF